MRIVSANGLTKAFVFLLLVLGILPVTAEGLLLKRLSRAESHPSVGLEAESPLEADPDGRVDLGNSPAEGQPKRSTPQTVLVLHLDEGTGPVARDATASGAHGSVRGATWSEGRFGGGLHFDGYDDCIDVGRPAALDFGKTADFTVECWINVPVDAPETFRFVITNRLRMDRPGFSIYLHKNHRVLAAIGDMVQSTEAMIGSRAINDSEWHHVALTADRDGEAALFIDGVVQQRVGMTHIVTVTNPKRPLRIGDRGHDGDFVGRIDEIRISRGVRTEFNLDGPATD